MSFSTAHWILVASVMGLGMAARSSATIITFDDLPNPTSNYFALVPNAYSGLNWNNYYYVNIPDELSNGIVNGETNGFVSAPNEAFNGNGNPASISTADASVFNLNSGYFTGVWYDNLSVTVAGYRAGTLVGSDTFQVNAVSATLENLNLTNVDSVIFTSSGGTPHGYSFGGGSNFAVDNLSVTIPEPVSGLLFAIGCTATLGRRRRLQ